MRKERLGNSFIYKYSNPTARNIFSSYYYQENELFPLKKYRLENSFVYGPYKPINYLKRNFKFSIKGFTITDAKKLRWIPLVKGKLLKN